MSSDVVEVRRLIDALVPKVAASPEVLDAQAIGNALGMLIWVSQTVVMIVLGLISLILLPKNYTKEDEPINLSGE